MTDWCLVLWQASCPAGTGPYGVSEPPSGSVCGEGYCKDFDGDDDALRCVCCIVLCHLYCLFACIRCALNPCGRLVLSAVTMHLPGHTGAARTRSQTCSTCGSVSPLHSVASPWCRLAEGWMVEEGRHFAVYSFVHAKHSQKAGPQSLD